MNEFSLWLNQTVIGPESSQDIFALGKAMDNKNLVDNYEYIFKQVQLVRNNHIKMGFELKNLINNLSNKNKSQESFEESLLKKSIKIYRIVKILKRKN